MLKDAYLRQVRYALFAEGIWGASARQFLDELADHAQTKIEVLRGQGQDDATAERAALQAIGSPSAIAAASREILHESLPARRPWLVAFGLFVLVLIALAIPSVLLWNYATFLTHTLPYSLAVSVLYATVTLMNWLPWALALGVLVAIGRRYPLGWRTVFLACMAIGIASTSIQWWMAWPIHGRGSGAIDFVHQPWLRPICWLIDRYLEPGFYENSLHIEYYPKYPACVIKLLLPITAAMTLRGYFRSRAGRVETVS